MTDSRPDQNAGRSPNASVHGHTAVREYPVWAYMVLTIITLLWLLLQLTVGLRQTDQAYPVTGYSMFSHPTDGLFVGLELQATTVAGQAIEIEAHEFGLTHLQFRDYLGRAIGGRPDALQPQAEARLEHLASVWESRQESELQYLELWRLEQHLDEMPPRRQEVLRWER